MLQKQENLIIPNPMAGAISVSRLIGNRSSLLRLVTKSLDPLMCIIHFDEYVTV